MTGEECNLRLNQAIKDLEFYVNETQDQSFSLMNFLVDLNDLQTELSVNAIYEKLIGKFRNGATTDELMIYVKRSKRIYLLAGGYVQNSHSDPHLVSKIANIHTYIGNNFDQALELFCSEYHLSN